MNQKQKNLDQILETLLKNRGLIYAKDIEEFFKPPHPTTLEEKEWSINKLQLKKALKRVKEALEKKEKIIVYGDYDVDGICASAILWETLKSLGADVLPYIPSRFSEGYGLNIDSIKTLIKDDPSIKLIITVDNGIVANEKVEEAVELGLDIIITDHHIPGAVLPNAYAIIHTTKVCGAAVAWFFSQALLSTFQPHRQSASTSDLSASPVGRQPPSDHLGLAALGTVTDVLPLIGLNRSIVVHGLKELQKTSRYGVVAVCEESGVKQEEIDTFHIGFVIGPRLNASGRLEHAMDSLRTICTQNPIRARDLASKLGQTNKVRQDKTQETLDHVNDFFGPTWAEGSLPKVLLAHHESYDEGIVGIVAGRLVEKYGRPAVVMSQGIEISKGSARSLMGVNIIEVIKEAGGGLLVTAGGHPMAAGFSLKTKDLDLFAAKLQEAAERSVKTETLVKNVRVDCELELDDITQDLYNKILLFRPFGYGNPEPTFKSQTKIESSRTVGKDNSHLKLVLSGGSMLWDAIGFRMGELDKNLKKNKEISIVYSVEEDTWPARNASASVAGGNGKKKLQLKLKNIANP